MLSPLDPQHHLEIGQLAIMFIVTLLSFYSILKIKVKRIEANISNTCPVKMYIGKCKFVTLIWYIFFVMTHLICLTKIITRLTIILFTHKKLF